MHTSLVLGVFILVLSQNQVLRTEEYHVLTLGLGYLNLLLWQEWTIKAHCEVSATQTPLRCHCGEAKAWMLSTLLSYNVHSGYSLRECLYIFIFNLLTPFLILYRS